MLKSFYFTLAFLFISTLSAQGLAGAKNLDRAVLINLGYGPFTSAGDLSNRFGSGWSIDGGATWIPPNSNLEFGFRVQYGFGTQLREDVLAGLRTREGLIIGNQRSPADIQLRQRQLFIGPAAGYTVALGKNKRAGIHLKTSLGYFFHRIRFQEDVVQEVPQLRENLLPGYDRLTGGFAVHQFIGYQQLALDRRLNFYLGAEAMAGFTKALRNFDIPTGAPPSTDGRTDIVLGIKAGLIIPLYFGEGREIFYK
ncbi:MAG: hypothetical protein ACJATN_001084 [Neolewinella sp.]|jgi:hypothetical protein